ncbi:hypothetical protein DSCA_52510 [Desulfosarcina alkanivorans]|uniref:Uncharacterized protein n=1 Tax=Desulfosarcina alkanivorans TaxID=571177 RepID=A0A5K7YW62_9BACT|nr:hypothetical protein DSCA_52510 [Desulfosarcina alkanivorans]
MARKGPAHGNDAGLLNRIFKYGAGQKMPLPADTPLHIALPGSDWPPTAALRPGAPAVRGRNPFADPRIRRFS